MIFTRNIGKYNLQAECDRSLQAPAERLLADLCEMHEKGPPLHDGSTILFGWVLLKLQQAGETLRVCEPDFLGNSIDEYIPQVDRTLSVLDDQARLYHQLGCAPKPTFYKDSIVVAKGCLEQPDLYLERQAAVETDDSGWYIGCKMMTSVNEKDLEVRKAYELVRLCPDLLQVLALPENYLATFSGKQIEAILNEVNERVWPVVGLPGTTVLHAD